MKKQQKISSYIFHDFNGGFLGLFVEKYARGSRIGVIYWPRDQTRVESERCPVQDDTRRESIEPLRHLCFHCADGTVPGWCCL